MPLSYDISCFETLLALIQAAESGEAVQFEGGEVCKVKIMELNYADDSLVQIENLNFEISKKPSISDLIADIQYHRINYCFIPSASTNHNSLNRTNGFFYYQTYKIKLFEQEIRNVHLKLKDDTVYKFSFKITPTMENIPQTLDEEGKFLAAGGTIDKGYFCNLL